MSGTSPFDSYPLNKWPLNKWWTTWGTGKAYIIAREKLSSKSTAWSENTPMQGQVESTLFQQNVRKVIFFPLCVAGAPLAHIGFRRVVKEYTRKHKHPGIVKTTFALSRQGFSLFVAGGLLVATFNLMSEIPLKPLVRNPKSEAGQSILSMLKKDFPGHWLISHEPVGMPEDVTERFEVHSIYDRVLDSYPEADKYVR
eukprot:gb/GEZN01017412.1/.p1 GENE.gb/GEZN01017412.1/~~gb/GEZN01017412.1/.p1  ORF type:complete len:198 (+),score=15.27 gb/GEZN01017412.1/:44-637(+)